MGHAHRSRLAILTLGLLALPLGGGGRRGPLQSPAAPPPTAQAAAAAEVRQDRTLNDDDTPGLIQSPNQVIEDTQAAKAQQLAVRAASPVAPRAINAPPAPAHGTFFLDPLLQ